jgi:hypothetical protein
MLVAVLDERRGRVGSLVGILAAIGLSICACTSGSETSSALR